MLLVKSVVAPSGIQGLGVFAAQPIRQGECIWQFMEGFDFAIPKATLASYPEAMQGFLLRYGYPHHELVDTLLVDGDHTRFMNHSDQPNTDFSREALFAYARYDIEEGAELTCDYREFWPDYQFYD